MSLSTIIFYVTYWRKKYLIFIYQSLEEKKHQGSRIYIAAGLGARTAPFVNTIYKKINHTANVVLAVAMLALSIDIFNSAYIIFGYYRGFPHFIGVSYAFPFLYGPIFYLYVKLISSGDNFFKAKYYLHFIPFILVVIYGLLFVYLKSSE